MNFLHRRIHPLRSSQEKDRTMLFGSLMQSLRRVASSPHSITQRSLQKNQTYAWRRYSSAKDWSVAEMKDLLHQRQISTHDCFEVDELIRRVQSSGGFPQNRASDVILSSPRVSERQIGPFSCIVVDNFQPKHCAEAIVVFAHGFGADNRDVADIAHDAFSQQGLSKKPLRFVFPNAPIELMGETSRAWWLIEPNRFYNYIMQGRLREICREVPDGISSARDGYIEMINVLQRESSLPKNKLILSGFSQGSMISCDVALRLNESVGALGLFSTLMICEEEWKKVAKNHKGLKVMQSHGFDDQVLPYATAPWFAETLRPFGLDIDFVSFHGGHSIPRVALEKFYGLIERVLETKV